MKDKKTPRKSRARKTSRTPTRIYSYGIPKLPKEVENIVQEQLFQANRYRNKLVELEIARRNEFRDIRKNVSQEVERLDLIYENMVSAYEAARLELSRLTRDKRSGSPQEENLIKCRENVKTAAENLKKEYNKIKKEIFEPGDKEFAKRKKERIEQLAEQKNVPVSKIGPYSKKQINKELCEEILSEDWPEAWKKKTEVENKYYNNIKEARSNSNCYTGVYLAVESAAERSFKDSVFNPRFSRFNGEGKVGIQVQKNTTLADLLGCRKNRIKLELHPEVSIRGKQRKSKRGETIQAATCRFLLGAKGGSVFLDIPFIYHREMPSDSVIKWVYVVARKVGLRTIYELQFTIESEQFQKQQGTNGKVAVSLGWRSCDDGSVVVGTTWDGKTSEDIVIPAKMLEQQRFVRTNILSPADSIFEKVRSELAAAHKSNLINLDIKKYKLDSIKQWGAHSKLARVAKALVKEIDNKTVSQLWRQWKKERFGKNYLTKKDLFDTKETLINFFIANGISDKKQQFALYLEFWRRKDEHLINWARGLERRVLLHRKDLYRKKAAELSRKYKELVIGDWDKSRTARKPSPDKDKRTWQEDNANIIRQLVGPSILINSLKHAFDKENLSEEKVSNISTHYGCGGKLDDKNMSRIVRCTVCGVDIDRNVNRAKHLFGDPCESLNASSNPGTSRTPENINNSGAL